MRRLLAAAQLASRLASGRGLLIVAACLAYFGQAAAQIADPLRDQQWYLADSVLAVDAAWTHSRGAGATVAVIDSGIDWRHEDLVDAVWQNLGEDADGDGRTIEQLPDGSWQLDPGDLNGIDDDDFDGDPASFVDDLIGWDFIDDDNDPSDTHGHGTHLAGLIGARAGNGVGIAGVAPESRLMALRIAAHPRTVEAMAGVEAIRYAVYHGADVLNLSWNPIFRMMPLEDAISAAAAAGTLTVISAGVQNSANRSMDYQSLWIELGKLPGLVVVSGHDACCGNPLPDGHFSQSLVTLSAPGDQLISTVPGGYSISGGVSMATALVSGAAALVRSRAPDLALEHFKRALEGGGRDLPAFRGLSRTSAGLQAARSTAMVAAGVVFSASELTFTDAGVGRTYSRSLRVWNTSEEDRVLEPGSVSGPFSVRVSGPRLRPGTWADVVVEFRPDAEGAYEAHPGLLVNGHSTDLVLSATGVLRPRIVTTFEATPPRTIAATYPVGAELVDTLRVTLEATGERWFEWEAVEHAGFWARVSPLGGRLHPGERVTISLPVRPSLMTPGVHESVFEVLVGGGSVVGTTVTMELLSGGVALDGGSAVFADLDGDGRLDWAQNGYDTNGTWVTRVYLNSERGYGLVPIPATSPDTPLAAEMWLSSEAGSPHLFGVVDGQVGRLDLEAVRWEDTGFPFGGGRFLEIRDADADLDLDVLGQGWVSRDGHLEVFDAGAASVAWADLNGDGFLDAATAPAGRGWMRQWKGGPDGLVPVDETVAFLQDAGLAVLDQDGDGREELLATGLVCPGENSCRSNPETMVFRGTGVLPLIPIGTHHGGTRTARSARGDLNGDGLEDVLLWGRDRTLARLSRKEGLLVYSIQEQPIVAGGMAIGDWTGDGMLDFAATGRTISGDIRHALHENLGVQRDQSPGGPWLLHALTDEEGILLTWSGAQDDTTPTPGLTYDVLVWDSTGEPLTPVPGTYPYRERLVSRPGWIRGTSYRVRNLPPGRYTWAVQAVDAGHKGSFWRSGNAVTVVGIESEVDRPPVRVYPSPVRSGGRLDFSAPAVRVEIYDVLGRKAAASATNGALTGLDLPPLVPGWYVVRVWGIGDPAPVNRPVIVLQR